MLQYIVRRLLLMVPTLFAISLASFGIIVLPPGDYASHHIATLMSSGVLLDAEQVAGLREHYGAGEPVHIQYLKWIWNLLHGDFGQSLEWKRPISELVGERLALTFLLSLGTLLFTWLLAFPIGIYSAVRQYSWGDYVATFVGFLGLATPDFLLALVLMWVFFAWFDMSVGGLFSSQYVDAAWSLGKVWDLFQHLWIPFIVLGTSGTAALIRIMRANLLDELHRPYVTTARAKGMSEFRLLVKYPVRAALNPFVSTAGWYLPTLVSGSVIVAVVLNLPIVGPLLLRALLTEDLYLAASIILLLSALTVIGTLISDILLAWLDPRIRLS
jgi:peptide/nickel transport system permease protein